MDPQSDIEPISSDPLRNVGSLLAAERADQAFVWLSERGAGPTRPVPTPPRRLIHGHLGWRSDTDWVHDGSQCPRRTLWRH